MAKYVVTGGAGFIGSNLCEVLVKAGHQVVAVDNLSVSEMNVPFLESLGVELVVADITDFDAILPAFAGADAVFHLAAMNRAQRSIEQPVAAHHANITGTLHVLEAMRSCGISKIVFVSSSSVYAGREGVLTEDDPLAPPHPYGVGKLAGEHYVRVYGELFGMRYVTLRFFSVYGPRQLGTIEKAGVVAKFIHHARLGKPLVVYGSGEQQRNFTFVGDVVRSCVLAMERSGAEGSVINIASPSEVSVAELADSVLRATASESAIEHVAPLAGDPKRNPADIARMRDLLGYTPQVSLEDGIRLTLAWYDETFTEKIIPRPE